MHGGVRFEFNVFGAGRNIFVISWAAHQTLAQGMRQGNQRVEALSRVAGNPRGLGGEGHSPQQATCRCTGNSPHMFLSLLSMEVMGTLLCGCTFPFLRLCLFPAQGPNGPFPSCPVPLTICPLSSSLLYPVGWQSKTERWL